MPKLEKVITGPVIQRKKSVGKRLKDIFFGEDIGSVKNYILTDILIPTLRDTLARIIHGSTDMLIYKGRGRGAGYTTYNALISPTYVSYKNQYNYSKIAANQPKQPQSSSIWGNDIIVRTSVEAETIISTLQEILSQYSVVALHNLKEMVGMETSHIDYEWGWKNLDTACWRQVGDGYLLDLPKVVPIR